MYLTFNQSNYEKIEQLYVNNNRLWKQYISRQKNRKICVKKFLHLLIIFAHTIIKLNHTKTSFFCTSHLIHSTTLLIIFHSLFLYRLISIICLLINVLLLRPINKQIKALVLLLKLILYIFIYFISGNNISYESPSKCIKEHFIQNKK